MNLKNVKLVHESDDHFYVDDGKKKPFRIAKHGLPAETVRSIQKHFAKGKVVRKMAEGGDVLGADMIGIPPTPETTPLPYEGTDREPSTLSQIGEKLFGQEVPAMYDPNARLPEPPTPSAASSQPETARAETFMPQERRATPQSGTGGPTTLKEFSDGQKQEAESLKAQADLAAKRGAEQAQLLTEHQKRLETRYADLDSQETDRKERLAAAQKAIGDGKIDPNRFWNSKSAGDKALSYISVILGSIGAGFAGAATGTPGVNMGVEALNKHIQADVDAQTKNLDSAHNRVRELMEEGHSIAQARSLATSELQGIAATQMERMAAQFLGPEKRAQLGQQIGQLKTQGALTAEKVTQERRHLAQQDQIIKLKRDMVLAKAQQQVGPSATADEVNRLTSRPPQIGTMDALLNKVHLSPATDDAVEETIPRVLAAWKIKTGGRPPSDDERLAIKMTVNNLASPIASRRERARDFIRKIGLDAAAKARLGGFKQAGRSQSVPDDFGEDLD